MFPPEPRPLPHGGRDARGAQRYGATIHLNAGGRHFAFPSRKKKNRTVEDKTTSHREPGQRKESTQHGKHLAGLSWSEPEQAGRASERESEREGRGSRD